MKTKTQFDLKLNKNWSNIEIKFYRSLIDERNRAEITGKFIKEVYFLPFKCQENDYFWTLSEATQLHNGAWFAALLGPLIGVQDRKNNEFSRRGVQKCPLSARASECFLQFKKTTHAITLKLYDFYYLSITLIIGKFQRKELFL